MLSSRRSQLVLTAWLVLGWPINGIAAEDCTGIVKAEWLVDGRKMRLLSEYKYVDPPGIEWLAPSGSVVDGASIPQFAWSVVGGPYEGKYRNASVVHDVACDAKARPWEQVHKMFYDHMLCSGVGKSKAQAMYWAVYQCGPRWGTEGAPKPNWCGLPEAASYLTTVAGYLTANPVEPVERLQTLPIEQVLYEQRMGRQIPRIDLHEPIESKYRFDIR